MRSRLISIQTVLAVAVLAVTGAGCGGDDEEDEAGNGTQTAEEPTAERKPVGARVVSGSGDITDVVQRCRRLLGPDNGGGPKGDPAGRRELNWDKVPDAVAAPKLLPADFFNAKVAPRARGAVLETPGEGVAVSADGDNPSGAAPRFGHINRSYSDQFKTFSPERLFSPIGSNVVDLRFNVPGTDTPAVVKGFGAVYTDVDKKENTAFEYFDSDDRSLGKYSTPVSINGLSFLGVVFERPVVARVRIEYGSGKLGPNESAGYDVAVMDDFIYGEPRSAGE
jgi:hypothetical protein